MTQNPINNSASELTVDNLFLDGNTISSTDTNGNIILAPDGSGEVSVTAAPVVPSTDRADSLGSATNAWDNVYADGITFDDGTNILDTFVDATSWTPGVAFGGGTTGITYSIQNGSYSRIGNFAVFSFNIVLSNKGSASGTAIITGLPFGFAFGMYVPLFYINVSATTNRIFAGGSAGTGTTITCRQVLPSTGALSVLTDTNFANNSQVSGTFGVMIT